MGGTDWCDCNLILSKDLPRSLAPSSHLHTHHHCQHCLVVMVDQVEQDVVGGGLIREEEGVEREGRGKEAAARVRWGLGRLHI